MQNPFHLVLGSYPLLRFAIPPFLIILVSKILFSQIAFDFPQYTHALARMVAQTPPDPLSTIALHEAKARLLWLISALLYFFISFGLIAYLWFLIKKYSGKYAFALFMLCSLLAGAEIFFLLLSDPEFSPIHHIFLFSYDTLSASALFPAHTLNLIHRLLDIINILAIFIPFFIIVCACSIVKQHDQFPDKSASQFKDFRELIQSSSALMIAGIIHMQLWLSWPISLSEPLSINTEAKTLIITILQYWGVCYSLTIAALYLPIRLHFENHHPLADNDKNIHYSISQKILQITSILGPSLVGAIAPELTNILTI